jgi:hypothetical protein
MYTISVACVVFVNVKKYPLTWSCGSLYKEANFHSCWPRAQSQQPYFKSPFLAPFFPFSSTYADIDYLR